MGKVLPQIDEPLAQWIARQRMFFVATAPLSREGHVNVSPKGGEAFRVLGPLEAVYQDYTGSGAETAAHLRENGRMVVMFCAFDGSPQIVRLHGTGTVCLPNHPRYEELAAGFPSHPGTRAMVHLAIHRVSSSCGWSVPLFEFQGERDNLVRWSEKQGPQGLEEYRANKNVTSIDGLPALGSAPDEQPI